MPFLRVVHDKRGYETTYLMELYREGHRQRSRILYLFRTPGGARGGREALDSEARAQLEVENPRIAFNWREIRENQQHIDLAAEPRRRRPKADVAPASEMAAAPEAPAAEAAADSTTTVTVESGSPRAPEVPSVVEGASPDEQMAFLAHWHREILGRIPRRTSDPARQEALTALAERLNPVAWSDADQITSGLQRASEALERLSRVFARRRRRRRRPAGSGGSSPEAPAAES